MPLDVSGGPGRFLTRAEDDELRRLNWICRIGGLSMRKRERMLELRLRDRRREVRPPRELAGEATDASSPRRLKLRRFRGR